MKRQDRQGVRTPADLEQKYDFTQSFTALEKRQRNNEVAQTQFENETEGTLASLKESAVTTNAALSNFNQRLTKTEKNALRLELAMKNMGGKPTAPPDLTQFWEKIDETKKQLEELMEMVSGLEQGSTATIGSVSLPAANWAGEGNLWHQVVDIANVTENSQVDLTPSVEQLAVFYEKDLAFVTENEDGVVTVYAIGQRPENDYEIQVTITEVSV